MTPRVGPGSEPLLVRRPRRRGSLRLRHHHRSARSCGARSNPRWLREHNARTRGLHGTVCFSERRWPRQPAGDDALARYQDNRNGRITCKEARWHGIAPVPRSHPAYRYMRHEDGDGVVCE